MQNKGIKYGLIAGVATVIVLLLFYFVEPQKMLSAWVINGTLMIYLIAMFAASNEAKKENGGELPFREGLKIAFICYLAANAIYFLFYYCMFNFFDPSLVEVQRSMTAEMLKWVHSGKDLQDALENLAEVDVNIYFSTVLNGFARGAIGGFILSLIVAILVERL